MIFLNKLTLNNVLFLLLTIVFLIYLYFKRSFTYWSSRGVVTNFYSFPLGNLNDIAFGRISVQEMFNKLYTTLKPKGIKYFGYYLLHQPVLVIVDLELIKSIMVRDFSHFTDHGVFDQRDFDTFGGHLFSLKGAEWKQMREKLSPLFTSGKLKLMFPTIENCSGQLSKLIDETAETCGKLDIRDVAGRYTTDIIASVGFGIESSSLQNPASDFRKYGERAIGNAGRASKLRITVQFLFPDLVTFFKLTFTSAEISNFFFEIVKSTIKYREENNVVRKDFMQLMIQLKNNVDVSKNDSDCFNLEVNNNIQKKNDSCSLSIEEVTAQTILFFIAGYDTSSVTITFCMFELAYEQKIQEKLRDEIKTVLKAHEGKVTYDAIMEMTYMDKCIKETLRKYPVIANLFRRCTKTYQVPNSDLVIEKGTIVFIPANEIHYDPEYYENPEKFDPERFTSENISARNPFTWLPFGDGPRICIGARLAMIQMKVALTALLTDFRYSLDAKMEYPLRKATRSFLITVKGGVWLNVEKITT